MTNNPAHVDCMPEKKPIEKDEKKAQNFLKKYESNPNFHRQVR
jgi:hypothetical protein